MDGRSSLAGKILIIESSAKIESIFSLNLEVYLGLKSITKQTAQFAIPTLHRSHKNIALIITRSLIGTERSDEVLWGYIQRRKLRVPLLILGTPNIPLERGITSISPVSDIKKMLSTVSSALKVKPIETTPQSSDEYFPIPINYLINMKKCDYDLYLQDYDDDGGIIYKQQFKAGTTLSPDKVMELIRTGHSHMLIYLSHQMDFTNDLTSQLLADLSNEELQVGIPVVTKSITSMELGKILAKIGLPLDTTSCTEHHIASMLRVIRRHQKLREPFQQIRLRRGDFVYQHSELITYVMIHMIRKSDWGRPEYEIKVPYASFFHDVQLSDPRLSKVSSEKMLQSDSITEDEQKIIFSHARKAADLLKECSEVPADSDVIVRQHHGNLNGDGFSDSYELNYTPLSRAFIVAEKYVEQLLDAHQNGREHNKMEIIQYLKDRLKAKRFAGYIELLEEHTS
jgi:hypothetical protein